MRTGRGKRVPFVVKLAVLAAGILVTACTREEAARVLRELPAAVPQADLSITPALFCPGETLTVRWDAGPQFSECEIRESSGLDAYGRYVTRTTGTGNCKYVSLDNYPEYLPPLHLDPLRLTQNREFTAPPGLTSYTANLEVLWIGWNYPPGRFTFGYNSYAGAMFGGSNDRDTLTAYARAYSLESAPEGSYNRNIVTAERTMFCDPETHTWAYQSQTRMRWSQYVCTPEGECTLEEWQYLPEPFSSALSACVGIANVCGGEEGPVTFSAPNQGVEAYLGSADQCSTAFNGRNPAQMGGLARETLEVEGGTGEGALEGQACEGSGSLSRVMYSIEVSPCTTPDQLYAADARFCEEAMIHTATLPIESGGDQGDDEGIIPICNLSATCGNGACDAYCEDITSCPADCSSATATAVPGVCDANGGVQFQGQVCLCSGVADNVTVCADGTKFDTITNQSCTPDPASCPADTGGETTGGGNQCGQKPCGNQVCEPACGENPNNCPADCP